LSTWLAAKRQRNLAWVFLLRNSYKYKWYYNCYYNIDQII
jgi:hypothetical protein